MTTPIPVDPLPTAPSRQRPATFSDEADAFLGTLPAWGQQVSDIGVLATTASVSAIQAAETAVATVGSEAWVSGTTYAVGDVVWSPTNYLIYRRKTNGAGATDPMSDAANWEPVSKTLIPPTERTANTELTRADNGSFIDITSGTFTQTFASASTLGAGWSVTIRNSGTGTVTLDPFSTDTIDGAATYSIYPMTSATLVCSSATNIKVVWKTGTAIVRLPLFNKVADNFHPVSMYEDITPSEISTGVYGMGGIIYGNGLFIAREASGICSRLATSPDGITWTTRTLPSSAYWSRSATNGTDKFVIATILSTLKTASSTDGITWTITANPPAVTDEEIMGLAFVGDRCLASYVGGVSYSDDNGSTWSATQTVPNAEMLSLYSFAGLFISPLTSGGGYYTSPTGATGSWTLRTFPNATTPAATRINNSGNLQVNFIVTCPYETSNGIDWTPLSDLPSGDYFEYEGVPFTLHTTFGSAKTYHNGVWTVRKSTIIANTPQILNSVWNPDRSVLCVVYGRPSIIRLATGLMDGFYAYFGGE